MSFACASTSSARTVQTSKGRIYNVALLPHLGSTTEETRMAMVNRVLDNIAAFLLGKSLGIGLLKEVEKVDSIHGSTSSPRTESTPCRSS